MDIVGINHNSLISMYFNKDKNCKRENNPQLWDSGCSECKKPMDSDVAVRVDVEDGIWNDEVFLFHKGHCFELGMSRLSSEKKK